MSIVWKTNMKRRKKHIRQRRPKVDIIDRLRCFYWEQIAQREHTISELKMKLKWIEEELK